LRLAIAQNPIHIASTVPKALDKVLKGGYIYPIQEDSIGMQMAKERFFLFFKQNYLSF